MKWQDMKQSSQTFSPGKLRRHTASYEEDKMYIFGGTSYFNLGFEVNTLFTYNFKTHKWDHMVPQNNIKPRCGHTCNIYQGKLYIFGGYNDLYYDEFLNDFIECDTKTGKFITQKLSKHIESRFGHSSVIMGNKMIIYGGAKYDKGWTYMNDMYTIDLETKRVKEINVEQTVTPQGVHGAIVHKNSMYVFGGLNNKGRSNKLHRLFVKSKKYQWEEIKGRGDIPSERAGHAIETDSKHLYISGGYNGNIALNDLYKYNYKTQTWTEIKIPMMTGRRLHSLINVKTKESSDLVIYGGALEGNVFLDDFISLKIEAHEMMNSLYKRLNEFNDVLIFTETEDKMEIETEYLS
eukprot:gene440-6853_t